MKSRVPNGTFGTEDTRDGKVLGKSRPGSDLVKSLVATGFTKDEIMQRPEQYT